MPSTAMASSSSSPAAVSVSESVQSESKAKRRSPTSFARQWTSRRSICSSIAARLVRSVGTTTMVRKLSGTPLRSARPGRMVAPNLFVAARFTSATAASEAGMTARIPSSQTSHPLPPSTDQSKAKATMTAVTIVIVPR